MWANHDVLNHWDTRLARVHEQNVIWTGKVDREEFEKICRRNIEKYFKHPQYYKIDGKPVFMVYDLPQLIAGLGGVEQTADALKWFKKEVKKAGFPGLELQFAMWSINLNYSGFDGGKTENPENDFIRTLGFTGTTHYQFAHFRQCRPGLPDHPGAGARRMGEDRHHVRFHLLPAYQRRLGQQSRIGAQRRGEEQHAGKILPGGSRMAREYIDAHPDRAPLITVNSWNEWTETSYLMPCDKFGYGYLEAVKKVFIDIQ